MPSQRGDSLVGLGSLRLTGARSLRSRRQFSTTAAQSRTRRSSVAAGPSEGRDVRSIPAGLAIVFSARLGEASAVCGNGVATATDWTVPTPPVKWQPVKRSRGTDHSGQSGRLRSGRGQMGSVGVLVSICLSSSIFLFYYPFLFNISRKLFTLGK